MCAMFASCGGVKNEVSDTEQPTLMDTMSLEEKVGQILFVRCVEDEQTDDLMSIKPGGILMFGRDFEGLTKDEVKRKIQSYQDKKRHTAYNRCGRGGRNGCKSKFKP